MCTRTRTLTLQAAGLVRGAYHFGHTNADAVQQATRFVQTVQNAGGFKMSKTLVRRVAFESSVCMCTA